jgi:Flavin-binding monooxygenase-like
VRSAQLGSMERIIFVHHMLICSLREISQFSKHVFLSDSTMESFEVLDNVSWVPRTLSVNPDGSIQFDHGCQVTPKVDTIIFCTGYDYSFPFVNEQSNLELSNVPGERRITPLFQQLWHAHFPTLSFLGLPHSVIPFPLFEHQAEAVMGHFFGSFKLPSREKRQEAASYDAVKGGSKLKGRVQDTHYLGSAQWEYCRDLAEYAGLLDEKLEDYIATNKVSLNSFSNQLQLCRCCRSNNFADVVYSLHGQDYL